MNHLSLVEFEKVLTKALTLDLPYGDRIQRGMDKEFHQLAGAATAAAVLVLFAHRVTESGVLEKLILFTRRTDSVETHKGQIAFPGGHCEDADLDCPASTALRETEEEVGISPKDVRVLGRLPSLLTVTRYLIQPVVGILTQPVDQVILKMSPEEIAETFWISVETLLAPGTYRSEKISVGTIDYPIDVFQVNHYRIWGATGSMTKNILDRIGASL